jgi:hypothetical protein
MDHVLENQFLNKELATREALKEGDDDTTGLELVSGHCMEEV